jgi:hypothetical protein
MERPRTSPENCRPFVGNNTKKHGKDRVNQNKAFGGSF